MRIDPWLALVGLDNVIITVSFSSSNESSTIPLIVIVVVGLFFIGLGYLNSKKIIPIV